MSTRDDVNIIRCCGKAFLTEHGYKIHKSRVHDAESKTYPRAETLLDRYDEVLTIVSGQYAGKKLHIPVSDDVDEALCPHEREYSRKDSSMFTTHDSWCKVCLDLEENNV